MNGLESEIEATRNKLNQVYYRIWANNRAEEPSIEEKHKWIRDKFYRKSIMEVIAKAVGDCATDQNEFAKENREDENIITFKGTNPVGYSYENWNAVFLYNYIDTLLNGNRTNLQDNRAYLTRIFKKIKNYYCDKYNGIDTEKLQKAKDDILAYTEALELKHVLSNIRYCSPKLYGAYNDEQDRDEILYTTKTEGSTYIWYKAGAIYAQANSKTLENERLKQNPDYEDLQYITYTYKPIIEIKNGELFITRIEEHELKKYKRLRISNRPRILKNYQEEALLGTYKGDDLCKCIYIFDLLNGLVEPLEK